ncbi:MAG: 23S rRNA (uracil(1939)-C(5))-methyltransferase RlmD [Flexilinea sp.]|nr:23S rRNA (uracil(1939)-C(5))-methyltransferase RlmD [Flexilinea sp.]
MKKSFEIGISRAANNGKGVGTAPDGKTVFVTGAVPGDRLLVGVTAERSRLYEAEIREILSPSSFRIPPDCPDLEACGGCCFRQMTYECELAAKQDFVRDAFRRIGGFDVDCEPILPSPSTEAYRNKAEFAVGTDAEGKLFAGFYSERTHRVVPVPDCRLTPDEFLKISENFLKIINLKKNFGLHNINKVSLETVPFDTVRCLHEPSLTTLYRQTDTRKSFFRHLVLRKSGLTGEIMLIIVAAAEHFPEDKEIADRIREAFPQVASVILNTNRAAKGSVLGLKNRVLSGAGFIRDRICHVPVEIGPLSFFQVNTPAAEKLYQTAAEFADIRPEDTVLDLYCGMGTIGLSMAAGCHQLIGGEIIPEAVESARRNAAAMDLENTRFLCGDAADVTQTLIREKIHPDLIVLDPPRRGCSPETLQAVRTLAPDRIVMVSCDPATAARDCRILCDAGYTFTRLRPVDLFPRTKHCESVIRLIRSDINS